MKKAEKIKVLKGLRKVIRSRTDGWGHKYVGLCQIIWWHKNFANHLDDSKYKFIYRLLPTKKWGGFCWQAGLAKPRIEWLNKQIKLLEGKK